MDTHRPGRSLPTTPTKPLAHRPSSRHRSDRTQLHAWADAAANGDRQAFAALYEACQGWVLRRCRARLSVHDAEDVCAEVFARTWRHLHAGKRIEHPLAWLATVTRNLIIDHHKRANRTVPAGDLIGDADTAQVQVRDPAPGPAELAADIDVTPLMRAWLSQLPPQARAAVTGHLIGEEQAVTSSRTGCSLPAVRSSLYRARKHLRARLVAGGLPCPPVGRC